MLRVRENGIIDASRPSAACKQPQAEHEEDFESILHVLLSHDLASSGMGILALCFRTFFHLLPLTLP